MQHTHRPDAPDLSPLESVNYTSIAWQKQLADDWDIMYSHPWVHGMGIEWMADIRHKQMEWCDDEDTLFSVCRNQVDPNEPSLDNIITISQDEELYGFCFFTVPNVERSQEENELAKVNSRPFEANLYARFKVKYICTHKTSFTGSGTVMLAIISKMAFAWMDNHDIPSCFIYIDQPLDEAKPFYKSLGFEDSNAPHSNKNMGMKLIKGQTAGGVHFPTRGTKRRRSDTLLLLL